MLSTLRIIGIIVSIVGTVLGIELVRNGLLCYLGWEDTCRQLERKVEVDNPCPMPVKLYMRYRGEDKGWHNRGWLVASKTKANLEDDNNDILLVSGRYYFATLVWQTRQRAGVGQKIQSIPYRKYPGRDVKNDMLTSFWGLLSPKASVEIDCTP